MTETLTTVLTVVTDERVGRLLTEQSVELHRRYGRALMGEPYAPTSPAFLLVRSELPIACGLLHISSESAEVRGMYVVPPERGRGHSRNLLIHLENLAVSLGLRKLTLRTGLAQPEAIALYASAGFELTVCPGASSSQNDRCFEKMIGDR